MAGVLPLCREAVGVFFSRSWQGNTEEWVAFTHTIEIWIPLNVLVKLLIIQLPGVVEYTDWTSAEE